MYGQIRRGMFIFISSVSSSRPRRPRHLLMCVQPSGGVDEPRRAAVLERHGGLQPRREDHRVSSLQQENRQTEVYLVLGVPFVRVCVCVCVCGYVVFFLGGLKRNAIRRIM